MKAKYSDFFNETKKLAQKSPYRQRHGAIIVSNGKIVGKGFNYAHGSGQPYIDGTHAEINAINNTTAKYRKGSTLYVSRLNREGDIKFSRPCLNCIQIMRKMGIKYMWYSDEGDEWHREAV